MDPKSDSGPAAGSQEIASLNSSKMERSAGSSLLKLHAANKSTRVLNSLRVFGHLTSFSSLSDQSESGQPDSCLHHIPVVIFVSYWLNVSFSIGGSHLLDDGCCRTLCIPVVKEEKNVPVLAERISCTTCHLLHH